MQPRDAPSTLAWSAPSTWAKLLGLLAAYYGLAWVGLRFALSDSVASPVWPPAGLAMAAGVLWGRRALPAVALGAFLVEITAGVPPLWSAVMAAGNTAEAAIAAAVVRKAGGAQAWRRPTGVLMAALGAAVAPLAAATAGAGSLVLSGALPAEALPSLWATWYLGDVAGILVLGPPLLLAERWLRAPTRPAGGHALEAGAAFVTLMAASVVSFRLMPAPVTAMVIAPLVWIAIRLGPGPASFAVLLLDVAAVVGTQQGQGPYAGLGPDLAFLLLQAFMLTVSLLGQAVAAVAADRGRAATELERHVLERTSRLQDEVAERRRAQEAVDEAQRVAHMGTWYWDISKANAEWSPELYRIYGLDPGTHVPTYEDYLTRVHPEDRERVKAATEAVFKDGKPYSHDERVRRPDGSWRTLHTWARAVHGPDGKLTALAGACQDITESAQMQEQQRRAEHERNESLERFRALAESSPIGIVHTRPDGHVDYANATWSRITGIADYTDDDAITRAIHPEDQPRSWALWAEAFRTGQPFQDDLRWIHPDGSIRYTSCRAVPTFGPDGAITGFVSTVEDITDRRAAEQARLQEQAAQLEVRRLREQADFKTNFLRTAAHELGTPLTPLKIQLRVLRELVRKRADAEEVKAVAILERNVDRLQVLVKDLLESARLQSGRLRLNARSMDLAHVVHDVVETFQEPAIQTGIALDAQVPPEMPMVGDPDRVTQVLYNLISNAMKFTPTGGRVHVVAEDLGELVRFEVQDDGAGFTAEQASHLFQPFSQVHDPMQVSKPGSGLGLYICKGIVEQHGGTITARSDGPGKGARFTVTMPRVARPPPPAATLAEPRLEPHRPA